jgi:hypothetical protein
MSHIYHIPHWFLPVNTSKHSFVYILISPCYMSRYELWKTYNKIFLLKFCTRIYISNIPIYNIWYKKSQMSQTLQLYECFSLVNSTNSWKVYFSLVVISADISVLLTVLIKGSDKSEKCIAKFHKLYHTQSICIKKTITSYTTLLYYSNVSKPCLFQDIQQSTNGESHVAMKPTNGWFAEKIALWCAYKSMSLFFSSCKQPQIEFSY